MSSPKKLQKWWNVIPGGTEGDEDTKLFIALGRHKKYEWRSADALAKESGLSLQRAEQFLNKYWKLGVVVQKPENEDLWAYWERVPSHVAGDDSSITDTDQDQRIDKIVGNPCVVVNPSGATYSGSPVVHDMSHAKWFDVRSDAKLVHHLVSLSEDEMKEMTSRYLAGCSAASMN